MTRPDTLRKILTYAILGIIFFLILAASNFRLLDSYELETLDFRFKLRPKIPTTDKIALIEIGEDAIEKLGRFPFDRSYHALLVKALSEYKAKAVVFDIFFSEPHKDDAELEGAIKEAGNVYMPYVFDIDTKKSSKVSTASGYIAKNLDGFSLAAKGTGHINIAPDVDGKFRRIPLYVKYKGSLYPYVSFLISCDYLGIDQNKALLVPGRSVSLGRDLKIPLDERSNMIINFSGKWGSSYRHYSYVDVLQSYLAKLSGQKPILDLSVLKDKVCIIGLTAAGTVDLHPNPFETLYPGVGLHAEVFNSLINRSFITRASGAVNLGILIFLGLLVSLLTLRTRPVSMLTILIGIVAIFSLISVLLFNIFGLWIDLFNPVFIMVLLYLSFTLYKYIGEWKKRLVLENELDIARKIQESFLPKRMPQARGLSIAASMLTAHKVGGDLYDFLEFGPERLGVVIGDVSGKGIPASLFMAMVTGKIKFLATSNYEPKDLLAKLNSALTQESSSNLFITVFYSIFDTKNNVMHYASGGHLPIIYLKPGRRPEFLDVDEGAPLGLIEGPYSGKSIKLEKGDIVLFYTDGITEAMNAHREMYGARRLAAFVESHQELSPKALLSAIEKDVRRFEPRSQQHDDITMIAVKMI